MVQPPSAGGLLVPQPPPSYPPPSAPPPGPAYPVPPPPPPRKDETLKILLIVIVAIVVLVAVVAIAIFSFFSNIFQGPIASKPSVTFGAVSRTSATASIPVTDTSTNVTPFFLRVGLKVSGVNGTLTAMPLQSGATFGVEITISGITYTIVWEDTSGINALSSGDSFTVSATMGDWPADTPMTFYLLWYEGSVLASAGWRTLPPILPAVTFTTPTATNQGWTFVVASAVPAAVLDSFEVTVSVDGVQASTAVALAAAMTLPVSGTAYRVNYTDVANGGTLDSGDQFRVMSATYGALPAGHTFGFTLSWAADGSALATVTWTT